MKLRSGKIINYTIQTLPVENKVENKVEHKIENTSFIKEMVTFSIISSSILLLSNLFDFKQFFQNISIDDIKFSLFPDI